MGQGHQPARTAAAPSLLVSEPPSHTRYRKLVTRVFSVRAVEALRSRTEEIAAQLLDELPSHADATGGSTWSSTTARCSR